MSTRAAGSALLRHLGPRVFGPVFSPAVAPPRPLLALAGGGERGGALVWVRVRLLSTSAAEAKEEVAASKGNSGSTAAAKAEAVEAAKEGDGKRDKVVSSYWGVAPSKLMNKDGAEWRWSCFRVSSAPTKGRVFR
jgi:ubiquinol oxidase